jgi:hypothetical protein
MDYATILQEKQEQAVELARASWEERVSEALDELSDDTINPQCASRTRFPGDSSTRVWQACYSIKGIDNWDIIPDDDIETLDVYLDWGADDTVTFRFKQQLQGDPQGLTLAANDPGVAAEAIFNHLGWEDRKWTEK